MNTSVKGKVILLAGKAMAVEPEATEALLIELTSLNPKDVKNQGAIDVILVQLALLACPKDERVNTAMGILFDLPAAEVADGRSYAAAIKYLTEYVNNYKPNIKGTLNA